ncbi:MAG: glycosyltransferase [Chlorobi bacterium]|nr:glycosyltransferase [Chlorobiota bacterium]
MNIAFVNLIGTGKFGGGEKWMVTAAAELTKKGHNVRIIGKSGSKLIDHALACNVTCFGIGRLEKITGLYLFSLARMIRSGKIDVLVCNLNTDVGTAGFIAKLLKTPVILARHGILMFGTKKYRYKLYSRQILDGIITNSNTIKAAYAQYEWIPPEFVKVIYNGLVVPEKIEPIDFSARYPGKKIIYSAGRLAGQKGFNYLIDAAAILLKNRNDLVFVISGEGKLDEELKKQAKEKGVAGCIAFEGFTPDIYPYLGGCDLFVLASLFEGMPNVVMEAMAVEKPVVATDVNGARELMMDGKTGFIVPPRDPQALAYAIGRLLDDPVLRSEFGQNGMRRVQENFTIPKMVENLERYFQEMLREKASQKA